MNQLLKHKNVIITGGTRGIGRAIVEEFAHQGANIIFTFNKSHKKASYIEQKLSVNSKIKSCRYNAKKTKDYKNILKTSFKVFNHDINILINNVGICEDSLLINMRQKHWHDVMNINMNSLFLLTKEVIKLMINGKKGGVIINTGSIFGFHGNIGQSNYAASKSGIIGFTKSISKEVGLNNIRCNIISPGIIYTDMTKKLTQKKMKKYINSVSLKRLGTTKEVAKACLFLASDMSSYITGEILNVNGGMCDCW